ncbi:MAG: sporulation protein YtfJ [Ruminococcaceae bacterium]|nr:sporulation protein YtfJ [Oscillospiraceae bacterium]
MSTPIEGLISVAMENIKGMVDVNTIVGDAVTTPDGATIVPISRVSFGFGAGGSEFSANPLDKKNDGRMFGGGSGGGASIKPVAFLIVNKDVIRILPVSNTMSTVDRVVDMIPEALNKFNSLLSGFKGKKSEKTQTTTETTVISEN